MAAEERSATGDFLASLNARIVAGRVPVSGSVELTHRCNLRCVHCFLGRGAGKGRGEEIGTDRWLSILDEAAAAGCMNLLITGGEPLVRDDFPVIYRRAKEAGMLVSLFTNGTLVDEKLLDLLSDLPPILVEISLYGATEETCAAVTGVEGAFARSIQGIERLLERGVPVKLKTMLLAENRGEWKQIRRIAEGYGVGFRVDPAVFPSRGGGREPLESRVSPEEAVREEFSDPERSRQWRDYYGRMKDLPAAGGLYTCGAGRTHFHVDPGGTLLPCLLAKGPSLDLMSRTFAEGWEELTAAVGGLEAGGEYECNRCERRSLCGLCPPFFELETGKADKPSPYLCRLGKERQRAIGGPSPEESADL